MLFLFLVIASNAVFSAKFSFSPSMAITNGMSLTSNDSNIYTAYFLNCKIKPISLSVNNESISLFVEIRNVDHSLVMNSVRLQAYRSTSFGIAYAHSWDKKFSSEIEIGQLFGENTITGNNFLALNLALITHYYIHDQLALSLPINFQMRNGIVDCLVGLSLTIQLGRIYEKNH